jgi:hypothetical protein
MRPAVLALIVFVLGSVTAAGTAFAESVAPSHLPSPSSNTFNLGFKALAEMIPDTVGQPLEDEHYGANGDSLQQTAKGMMVWRKADNWTAFTDGSRTWINGPLGLQNRENTDRFPWESSATSGQLSPGEITLYDRRGTPAAYIATNDENTIYLWTGEPSAYLYSDQVYGFNGQHLGWFQDGILWDYEAVAVGFTQEAQGGYHVADPAKMPKSPRPAKLAMEPAPPQPPKTRDVFTELLSALLHMGQIR